MCIQTLFATWKCICDVPNTPLFREKGQCLLVVCWPKNHLRFTWSHAFMLNQMILKHVRNLSSSSSSSSHPTNLLHSYQFLSAWYTLFMSSFCKLAATDSPIVPPIPHTTLASLTAPSLIITTLIVTAVSTVSMLVNRFFLGTGSW